MKKRIVFIVTFIGIHLFLITSLVVFRAYRVYPEEVGRIRYLSRSLKEIYDEIGLYKEETGSFPEKIDSLLHCDKNTREVHFRSKKLSSFPFGDVNNIRYQLVEGEPVITFLGYKGKEGGLEDWEYDIYYPQKFQPPFLFNDFMKTNRFYPSLVLGFLLGFGISVCLFGIWKKQQAHSKMSLKLAIFISVIFLLFELFLADAILFAHLYPHH